MKKRIVQKSLFFLVLACLLFAGAYCVDGLHTAEHCMMERDFIGATFVDNSSIAKIIVTVVELISYSL